MTIIDAQLCFITPDAVIEVVRRDPVRPGSQGPGHDGPMKEPMINTFIRMMRQSGMNPGPTQFLAAVAEVEGWCTTGADLFGWREVVAIDPAWRRRVAGAYCAFCNGLVVAGHCFMSGRILSCYWSKIKDCTGKADLIILRKDGVEVSVGLTMDSAEAKYFEQRKMAKSARNGQKWPDRMLYLDRVTHRDEASNMAWYRQEDIEPIFTWSKEIES